MDQVYAGHRAEPAGERKLARIIHERRREAEENACLDRGSEEFWREAYPCGTLTDEIREPLCRRALNPPQ